MDLSVVVDEARVFIPASLVSDTYEKDLELSTKIRKSNLLSASSIQEETVSSVTEDSFLLLRKQKSRKNCLLKLKVGDVIEGTVKNVTDFGAFIDLGGVDGLLHISEMSWGQS